MDRRTKWIGGAVLTAALVGGSAGIAGAVGEDASETPITGSALDQASAAALRHTGGGRVTGTEVGDEEGYYEIEVTLDDGSQTDVHLDENFTALGQENDSANDGEGTRDAGDN